MRKIRVLHYVTGFAETSGGIESFLFNLMTAFQGDELVENVLFTRYCYKDAAFYSKYINAGFKVDSLGINHLGISSVGTFITKLNRYFRDSNADILHIHGTDEPFVIDCARKAGFKRIILHSHTVDIEMNGRQNWVRLPKLILRKSNIKKADVLIGCSKNVVEGLFKDQKNKPSYVIPNAIDTSSFIFDDEKRKTVRKKYGIEQAKIIGHVGRFVAVKNHEWILRVFKSIRFYIPDAKLLFVGDGELFNRIVEQVKELGFLNDVIFAGEQTEISSFLSAMDVMIFPSLFEGLGITAIEAQANGLPVAISENIPEDVVVTDLVRRLSLGGTPDEWAKVMISMLPKKDRREYAKEVDEKGYGLAFLCNKLTEIYR